VRCGEWCLQKFQRYRKTLVGIQEVAIAYAEFSAICPKEVRVVQSSPCRRRDPTLTPIHCCLQVGVRKAAMSRAVRCIFRHLPLALRNALAVRHGTEDAARSTACCVRRRSDGVVLHSDKHDHAARSTQYAARRPSDGVDYRATNTTTSSTQHAARSTQCGGPATEWITQRQVRARSTEHAVRRPSDGVDYTATNTDHAARTQRGGPATERIT
jgi:hypothetical protein